MKAGTPAPGLGWLPQPPDPNDFQLVAHHPELMASVLKQLRRTASLRGRVPVIDQAVTNSCVGHGVWRAFMHALIRAGLQQWDASPFFIYYCARLVMGGNWPGIDQGAYIRDGIKGLGLYGTSSNGTYPRYQPLLTPSQQAFAEALSHQALKYTAVPLDMMTIKTVLDSGIPIVVGVNCYSNYSNVGSDGNWPDPVGNIVGGHCITLEGYDDDRGTAWQVEAAGSWGPGFGDRGYHWLKWDYLLSQGADFWMVELVEGEPAEAPPAPEPDVVMPGPVAVGILDARNEVSNPGGNYAMSVPIGIAVHHTVGAESFADEAAERTHIRMIDAMHKANPGWGGFAYHMAVFASGRVYLCGDLDRARAHVAKRNHELIGVVMVGTFTNAEPTDAHYDALAHALEWVLLSEPGLEIRGHREWSLPGEATSCPGVIVPRDWDLFLNPQPAPDPSFPDGWRSVGPYQVLRNQGVDVLRVGGSLPGQVSKNFGGQWFWWVKEGDAAKWSPVEGD